MDAHDDKHIVDLARKVAARWIASNVRDEHRITVYQASNPLRNLPSMLRAFRDGRFKLGSVGPIKDLGVRVGFDHLEVWSADRVGLLALDGWLQKRGCETSGIW